MPNGTFEPKGEKDRPFFGPYTSPNYTQVPDKLFDEQLPHLSGAELKVLLYIMRRTFGFKKNADAISLNQICNGITTRDGRILDRGTGLGKRHVISALRALEKMGIIISERRSSPEKGFEPTVYTLNTNGAALDPSYQREQALVTKGNKASYQREQALVTKGNIQETVLQHTVKQETVLQETASSGQLEEKEKNDAADVLIHFGISKTISNKLTQNYPQEYVLQKLDLAQWLVKTGSPLVAKNPAGWLRKAIEDDYQPPPQYKSPGERSKEAQILKREQQQRREAEEEYHQAKEEAQRKLREQYPPQPIDGTTLTTETAWNQTLEKLKEKSGQPAYEAWLKDTNLLDLEGNTAIVSVASSFAKEWLERRLYSLMVATLQSVTGRERMEIEFVVNQLL